MKLKRLTRKQMAMIAVAANEYDETGELETIVTQIGEKLGIDAVYGEGYDATVWRCCRLMCGMSGSASERIVEALYNIGINNANLIGAAREGLYKDVLDMLGQPGANEDYLRAKDSVNTILTQHANYTKQEVN